MSITLDDKAVDVFKLYDEMTAAYSKDIKGYKTLLKAIEAMITQKEEMLQGIKDKTVALVKRSLEITESQKIPVLKQRNISINAGAEEKELEPKKEIESGETIVEITPPNKMQVKRTISANRKKTTGKGKVQRADKLKKISKQSKKITEAKPTGIKKSEKLAKAENEIKCLYHPESAAVDIQRQLCSSCRWKLRSNGLTEYDKDPAVVSFLKGETKNVPNLGQPMCPVHPDVPAYNKKNGLCQRCQSKAKAIGVTDRHLTDDELDFLRNPVM
jgi:hypothetical protein